jgi:hypothetical protein
MNFRNQKMLTAAALFVIFAVTQVYIGVSFAEPNGGGSPAAQPQQLMGILTTRDNQPVLVNGVSTVSGATIPSGAAIETPDKVGATINVGALGSICIAPNTKVAIVFDQSGKKGNIDANLTAGCVILTTVKDVMGAVKTTQAVTQISGGTIDVCLPTGEPSIVNKGAASSAGAGASGLGCNPPAGAAALPYPWWDLGTKASLAIAGGTAATVCIIFCNPSPSTP